MKVVTITVLLLVASSQGSPIEGVFETVKNSTIAFKEGIHGMLSEGKSLVFGKNNEQEGLKEGKPAEPSQGIIDKISLKVHDVSEGVRESFRNVLHITDKDSNGEGKGVIKTVYDGVKNKVDTFKGFFFGTTQKPIEKDDATKLKELVNQIMSSNVTLQDGKKPNYDELINLLDNASRNLTKAQNPSAFDGANLLDVRTLDIGQNIKGYSDDAVSGINAVYDKVEDGAKDTYNKAKSSIDSFRQNVAGNVNHGTNYFKENLDRFASDAKNNFDKYTN